MKWRCLVTNSISMSYKATHFLTADRTTALLPQVILPTCSQWCDIQPMRPIFEKISSINNFLQKKFVVFKLIYKFIASKVPMLEFDADPRARAAEFLFVFGLDLFLSHLFRHFE